MKLCPQCDFIYEDDQGFCDMDGKKLVHDPATGVVDQNVSPIKLTNSARAGSRARRLPALFAGVAVLAVLLSLIYFGQRHQSRRSYAADPSIRSLEPPTARNTNPQPSPVNSITVMDASLSAAADATASPSASEGPAAKTPLTYESETSAPASSDTLARNGSGPVIVRLTNGASIRADDAWETKNGVWYRQGGMVTFLKRSRVRAIERPPTTSPRMTKPANKKGEKTGTAGDAAAAQTGRLEPDNPKRESRVTSFLKKTGQILKKPFKL